MPATYVKIPGYQVLGKLGRGGQSDVYEAVEDVTGTRVAIKIVPEELSDVELDRLEREYVILSALKLDGVVSVFNHGRVDGRFFFVLELIEGGNNLTSMLDSVVPQSTAAETISDIARTLQRVHDSNVIHRDLKPSNVLRSNGRFKLADFGLARKIDETRETTTGRIMGTYDYMSPEQSFGAPNVDQRSDVYSLGVMLYELLVGEVPFSNLTETRSNKPPRWPSHLVGAIPRQLRTICQKALEKRKTDRFTTACELADELDRFLARKPIQTKYGWRHNLRNYWLLNPIKSVVWAFGSLLLGAVLLGTFGFATQYFRANAALKTAKQNLGEAIRAFDFVGREVGSELSIIPRQQQLQRRVLERAVEFNEALLQNNPEETLTIVETGLAHLRVGQFRKTLGDVPGATMSVREAIDTVQSKRFSGTSEEAQRIEAEARYALAGMLLSTNQIESAQSELDRIELLSIMQKEANHELRGGVLTLKADVLKAQQHLEPAISLYRAAISICELLLESNPGNEQALSRLAKSHGVLAVALSQHREFDAAKAEYATAIQLFRKAGKNVEIATAYRNLAILNRKTGQLEEAVKLYHSCQGILEKLVNAFPETIQFQNELAGTLHGMALTLLQQQKPEGTLQLMQRSLNLYHTVYRTSPEVIKNRKQVKSAAYVLCSAYAHNGMHRKAFENIPKFLSFSDQPIDCVNAAILAASCGAEVVFDDENLSETEREEQEAEYLEEAIRILTDGKTRGLVDDEFLRTYDRLSRLRNYAGFASLLSDIDGGAVSQHQ